MKNQSEERDIATAIYVGTLAGAHRFDVNFRRDLINCWNFCEKKGWKVAKVFVDLAERNNLINRKNFQEMIREARTGKFDVVIFCSLKDLCNSPSDFADVTQLLRQFRIPFRSLDA
jgi:DNA invertase Pin-like site-specific DNA recombinase